MSKPTLVAKGPLSFILLLFGIAGTGGLLSLILPSHIAAVQEENRRQIFLSSMAEAGSMLGLLIYTLLIFRRFFYIENFSEERKVKPAPTKKRRFFMP